jgi:hypothetical protein
MRSIGIPAYFALLALALGAGLGISQPAKSADGCALCRSQYLNCLRSAGNNQTLIAQCTYSYEVCMDRC